MQVRHGDKPSPSFRTLDVLYFPTFQTLSVTWPSTECASSSPSFSYWWQSSWLESEAQEIPGASFKTGKWPGEPFYQSRLYLSTIFARFRFWGIKFILILAGIVGAFFGIPHGSFGQVWMYFGMVGGFLFILVQLVLIVDFAHNWAESWQENYRYLWFASTILMVERRRQRN